MALGAALFVARPIPSAEDPSPAPKFPAGLAEVYRALSESILKEDMPTFMKVFHLDYIYEAMDGAALDRGPWRRLWLDRFADLEYHKMAFAMEKILEEEDDRIVLRVRRVALVESAADRPRQLEETVYEDTWVRSESAWQLQLRTENEIRSRGTVSQGAGVISSPRIATLASEIGGDDKAAIEEFWKHIRSSGAPLVETIARDPASHALVTFLWRGTGKETSVRVRGGLATKERSKPLTRLRDTDVWYRSERLPSDARFTYEFHLTTAVEVPPTGKQKAEVLSVQSTSADPLNPISVDGKSVARLPEAPAVSWTQAVDGIPRGSVKRQTLSSEVLGERRFVSVYTPPGYDELQSPCSAAFVLDHGTYKSRRVTGTVLDNLLAEEKIPPTVVFMVHSEGSRRESFEASIEFVHFLGEELLGWARAKYRIRQEPERCVLGGNGLGGLLAAATAVRHSRAFGGVLSQNADFSTCIETSNGSQCVPRGLALTGDRLPIRFFLSVGRLEDASVVDSNRHLRDVLDAKGYAATFRPVTANQHATSWQDALGRGLMVLLSR